MDLSESPPPETIVDTPAPRAPDIDRHAARRIRLKLERGEMVTGEERALLDAYKAAHPRGRKPGSKNRAPTTPTPAGAPPEQPPPSSAPAGAPQVVDFSQGAPGAPVGGGAPAAPAAPVPAATCGDPHCVTCARGVKLCPVSGQPIRPRISLEAAATFSGMLLGGVALGIKAAFKGDVTAPSADEITKMAPAMQELVWRRFGEAEEYADIAAVLGLTVAFGFGRAHEAVENRKAAMAAAGGAMPKQDLGGPPKPTEDAPVPSDTATVS